MNERDAHGRFLHGNKAAVGHGRKRKGKPLRIDEESGGYIFDEKTRNEE